MDPPHETASIPPPSRPSTPNPRPGDPPNDDSHALHRDRPVPEVAPLQPYDPTTRHPPPSLVPTQHSPRRSLSSTTSSTTLVASSTQPSLKILRPDAKFMAGQHHDPEKPTPSFYPPSHMPTRPLIDFVTNEWKNAPHADIDSNDSDDECYRRSCDSDSHPRWAHMDMRIPRRIQRYFVIYATLCLAAWLSWKYFLKPEWEVNREIDKSLDEAASKFLFGANMRPAFSDMVHIKTMDTRLLPMDENSKQRLVIVGDVHGCVDELQALLKKVNFRAPNDHLILAGDLIAKGPSSPAVVSLASSLGASCVRGNHEDRLLLAHAAMRTHHAPLRGPTEDPSSSADNLDLESFSHGDYPSRHLASQLTPSQLAYLAACPVILRVGEIPGYGEMVVAHAGLVPGIPLERQDPYHVMNMRTVDLETHMPSENRTGTPWEKLWNRYQMRVPEEGTPGEEGEGHQTVVYGHDSKRGKNVQRWSVGLDSGCVSGGRLTALVVEAGAKEGKARTRIVSVGCKNYLMKKSEGKRKSEDKKKSET